MGVGKVAAGLGIGLVAGLVGTAAMTAAQTVEMRIRNRKPSTTPARAAEKVLHVHPDDEAAEAALNQEVHFAYGTGWGAVRALLDVAGLRGVPATAIHFAAIQGAAFVMLPGLKVAPPVKEWGAKAIAIEMMHHGVYAIATGLTYDALMRSLESEAPQERRPLPVGAILTGVLALRHLRRRPTPLPVAEVHPESWHWYLDWRHPERRQPASVR